MMFSQNRQQYTYQISFSSFLFQTRVIFVSILPQLFKKSEDFWPVEAENYDWLRRLPKIPEMMWLFPKAT